MEIEDSAALVTGASSGIGEATAVRLGERGARVALAARRESALDAVADRVEAAGGDALVVPTDVTDEAQVDALVERVADGFGRLDLLVDSAGVMYTDPVAEADPDEWRQMVEVNLLGTMNVTRRALGLLTDRDPASDGNSTRETDSTAGGNPGHVVLISSMNARKASREGSGYCASKFGVNGFAESLRQEMTTEGVRVSVVEPGLVATEMQDEETVAERPTLDPADVAEAVEYAVSQPPHVSVNELLVRPTEQEF